MLHSAPRRVRKTQKGSKAISQNNKFYFAPLNPKNIKIKDEKSLIRNGYFGQIIYNRSTSLQTLARHIRDGDTIELHGDGLPWVMGGVNYNAELDLNPFTFANLLDNTIENKDINLIIDLRFCSSGVEAVGPKGNFNFTQDLSKALANKGFRNIQVYGYTGYINSESQFRQSVSSVGDGSIHGAKIKHCTLDDGRLIYQNGELLSPAKKTLVDEFPYDRDDIRKDGTLRDYLAARKECYRTLAEIEGEGVLEHSFDHLVTDKENAPLNFMYNKEYMPSTHESFKMVDLDAIRSTSDVRQTKASILL
ncbi:hypothetical protein [Candidatus Berkiella aquae]|uniref:Uncharacterized protein n=1 Tax=Candidatus Berkiella aquae TaxID=295108 RepID=A0A0Q9YZC4_9GAMM|nr:hypothetical protein [Candidatus Berkiella aquae]MCS5711506.1 hypothetical protein [Candidatus Berkiella aquae]